MPSHHDRLVALRAELDTRSLDGFVVPLTDEHLGEYVGAPAQRLGWLTGFAGSAGTAVAIRDRAAIFTDGRYTIQVRDQVDGADWQFVDVGETGVVDWLVANVSSGMRIGYDPWLHTGGWAREAASTLEGAGAALVPVTANPIDAIWHDRPDPSPAPMIVHEDEDAGRSSAAKRADIADWLCDQGADALVLPAPDSIAWLLNVRGDDIAHMPVALAFAIADADGAVDLFVAPEKVTDAVRRHLGNAVRLHPRERFADALGDYRGKKVAVDPGLAVGAIGDRLEAAGATVLARRDPTILAKAVKNATEIAGHRAASLRDGAALTRFLRWVAEAAAKGGQTELSAAAKLRELRSSGERFRDCSFDTISATGAHGALPHYHATQGSDAPIEPGQLYLVDSGGQYADGTTDVTRVVPIGVPAPEMRDRFTRVLKGHIALATTVFPPGTTGAQLDGFARAPLWAAGLDFAHGTGHGVGSYLSVHEGPARIAKPGYPGGGPREPLLAGMILSNEPGYYKAGAYGIRIENLVLVEPRTIAGGDAPMLGFETLTLAPIDRDLIDVSLLGEGERAWLDAYHARVATELGPLMDADDRRWLEERCAPLG